MKFFKAVAVTYGTQVIRAKISSITARYSPKQRLLKAAILNNIQSNSIKNDESEVNDLDCKDNNELMQILYQKSLKSASKGKGSRYLSMK